MIAAFLPKMRVATHERVEVKLLSMRMIARLKLGAAKTRFLADFVDAYLKLDPDEAKLFKGLVAELNRRSTLL